MKGDTYLTEGSYNHLTDCDRYPYTHKIRCMTDSMLNKDKKNETGKKLDRLR